MNAMLVHLMTALRERQKGQGLVEYALILALVSIATIVALQAMAVEINDVFNSVTSALTGV